MWTIRILFALSVVTALEMLPGWISLAWSDEPPVAAPNASAQGNTAASAPKPQTQQLQAQSALQQNAGPAPEVEKPTAFVGKDGKPKGWKVVIPGGRSLATPAIVEGKVFLGGGFGSHEFYALDAKTGKLLWQYRTGDDGPTAAV